MDFTFTAPLWRWKPEASWHFITVPADESATIKAFAPEAKRGFGSVRVRVQVGETAWQTSLFPDKKSGCYLLPVKKAVRSAEELAVGEDAEVRLELVM
ncbi:MAG: DUF1905 domain-containing protein [Pseudomonadota bacterium]